MWPFSKRKASKKALAEKLAKDTKLAFIRKLSEDLIFLVPVKENGAAYIGLLSELRGTQREEFRASVVEDFIDTAENILAVRGYASAVFYINIFHTICYSRAVVTFSCDLSGSSTLDSYLLKLSCKYAEINANALGILCNLDSKAACELLLLAERSYERYDTSVGNFIKNLERN
jgi:hypothetical protein